MSVFWPFKPNGIREKLMFRTDVRSTESGEVRYSIKDATQIFNLQFSKDDLEGVNILKAIESNVSGSWLMPVWSNITRTSATISSGVNVVNAETDADYSIGGQCVIIAPNGDYEILTIDTISQGSLSFTNALSRDYPAKSLIAPVGEFILPAGLNQSLIIKRTMISLEFYRVDSSDLSGDRYNQFKGYDVLSDSPAVLTPLSGGLRRSIEFVQNGFGVFALEELENYTRWRATIGFLDTTYESRHSRFRWLHKARGKDTPFWLPSWKNDLELLSGAVSGSSTLSASEISENTTSLVGHHIQIKNRDDAMYREITNVTVLNGQMTITVDQPLSFALTGNEKISFLRLVRFDTDVFEMRHQIVPYGFASSFTAPVVEVIQ